MLLSISSISINISESYSTRLRVCRKHCTHFSVAVEVHCQINYRVCATYVSWYAHGTHSLNGISTRTNWLLLLSMLCVNTKTNSFCIFNALNGAHASCHFSHMRMRDAHYCKLMRISSESTTLETQ